MIAPPCYYSIDEEGVFDWYRILDESVDIGIMIYDQSWRTGLGTTLTPPLIERLAGLDSVVSLKYGSPNLLNDMAVVIDRFADRFAFIDNSLGFTSVSSHMHGATGHISGPATWWPEFELSFFDLMEEGRYAEADRWHARFAPYMAWHHGEHWKSGPVRVRRGGDQGVAGVRWDCTAGRCVRRSVRWTRGRRRSCGGRSRGSG